MARYSKIVRQRKKAKKSILPETWQAFIARRIIDTTAFVLALGGLAILLAMMSYTHTDPSMNTASAAGDKSIQNWLGLPGAYIADLMWQTVGLGGTVFGLVMAVWGGLLWRRHAVSPVWWRTAMMLVAALLVATASARIPAGSWLPHAWMGGSGGILILDTLAGLAHPVAGVSAHLVTAVLAGLFGVLALLQACTVTRHHLVRAARAVWSLTRSTAAFAAVTALRFYEWLRHYGDPDYEPKIKKSRPAKKKKPKKAKAAEEQTPAQESDEKTGAGKRAIRVVNPQPAKSAQSGTQTQFNLADNAEWELPPVELLQEPPASHAGEQLDEEALRKNAEMLQNVLADFNVEGEIVSIHPGPVVTLYELEPAPGVKSSRVIGLSDDIARSMAAVSVRCSVIPGRNVIGIELPNARRQTVYMREMLESRDVQKSKAKLPLVLGKTISGQSVTADLAKMPHLLVAGTTGSGKSVAVNAMLLSLLYRMPPEKCRLILIDPKMLELSVYNDIPHLLSPVVTEPGKAVVALKWAVQEMENRYRAMSKLGVRNIEGYNQRLAEAHKKGETLMRKVQTGFDSETGKPVYEEQPMDMTELPYIVIVVDEFADLMLVAGKDVEGAIQRLAQMARAAGIHMIMATQRPSVDVITGVIKANFPTRISFSVTSKIDSRTILGEGGAEQLLGLGDMLHMAPGGQIKRVHGPFVSDDEVEDVVNFLKAQSEPSYIEDVTEGGNLGDSDVMSALFGDEGNSDKVDELYDEAVALVAKEQKASTSFVQRHLQIGYNRAARIIEEMEKQGVIGAANHVGKREVLVSDFSDA